MKVNEIFGPTIQGEGKSAGVATMFLRLPDCNLACIWCDTAYTWNWLGTKFKHPEKYDRQKETHSMTYREIKKILRKKGKKVRSLVISFWLRPLYSLGLLRLAKYWIEVETNGTLLLTDEFIELVDQINCSPKTNNSGRDNDLLIKERPEALKKLAASGKTFFKFVVKDRGDLPDINRLVSGYHMKNVYLMAEGNTREEQQALASVVMEMCRENNFNFSPRLHVLYWNRARGV